MDKQYQLNLTEEQLERLIELSKRGIVTRNDNRLIQYLEYVLKVQKKEQLADELGTTLFDELGTSLLDGLDNYREPYYPSNYDEIPF